MEVISMETLYFTKAHWKRGYANIVKIRNTMSSTSDRILESDDMIYWRRLRTSTYISLMGR